MNTKPLHTGIACSIFKKEIETLIERGKLSIDFTFIDSEYHMYPDKLDEILTKNIRPDCVLCYGHCHSHMVEQQSEGLMQRVEGMNCCEIFIGKTEYRRMRAEGAFFLLPEWTHKWERVFKELLGFSNQSIAIQFMNEMHKKFIYIDTGVLPVPNEILNDISKYFELPIEICTIDLSNLENSIIKAIKSD